jgi:ATP-dependent helicase/nuclease subunit A
MRRNGSAIPPASCGRIARAIKAWLAEGLMLEARAGAAAEDVMILVKRRGELASLIVARLYAEGVPVAGVDRLRLNAPLAVQDLLAAIRFVLQPEDDLSLASLLVSPLIGWSQDELMARRCGRRGRRCGASARAARKTGSRRWRRCSIARISPRPIASSRRYLSGALDGRRKLLLRLGEEARDPIEELLNAALNFESLGDAVAPALPRLVRSRRCRDRPRCRAAAGAVRVMTAHGAKGLQAPLVILADATVDPTRSPRDFLLWAPEDHDAPPFPIFRPRAAERGGPLDAVARTRRCARAAGALAAILCRGDAGGGAAGDRRAHSARKAKGVPPEASWYAACARLSMRSGCRRRGPRISWDRPDYSGLAGRPPGRARKAGRRAARLDRAAGTREARPPRPLAPSSLGEDLVADPPPTPALRVAAERGRLLHALFERLPALAPDMRADPPPIAGWPGPGGVEDAAARGEIAAAALAVIEDPRFAELFAADALAEAPIAAVVEGLVVSGTVDRLVVGPTASA